MPSRYLQGQPQMDPKWAPNEAALRSTTASPDPGIQSPARCNLQICECFRRGSFGVHLGVIWETIWGTFGVHLGPIWDAIWDGAWRVRPISPATVPR